MPWRDRRLDPRKRVVALLTEVRSRSDAKRLGAWLDEEGQDLVPALLEEAGRRGVELPDEAAEWAGKKLLRLALGRQEEARRRTNPVRRDETFQCVFCGLAVPQGGRTVRDHCPRCLRSVHVDVVPGDRAAGCGGVLEPVSVRIGGRAEATLTFRCARCGAIRRNRCLLDGPGADDPAALRRLSAGEGAPEPPWAPWGERP